MQCARANEGKVGHQRAHLGDMLDPPSQPLQRRKVLDNDRRRRGRRRALGHDHVDFVALKDRVQMRFGHCFGKRPILSLGCRLEKDLDLLLDRCLLVFWQLLELVALEDISLLSGSDHESHRRSYQCRVFRAGALREIGILPVRAAR